MPRLALALYALYVALAFGWRTWRQLRTTGKSGLVDVSRAGGLERFVGALLVAALALGLASPLAALQRGAPQLAAAQAALGIVLYAAGLALTLAAQLRMGASWRIGVDPSERTQLVTGGPFALARNPIFTGMIAIAIGLALLVPNGWALGAVGVLVLGIELQVRLVEEPYLLGVHGEPYRSWASGTGRFLPGIGRLR
ncbi:MAG TPA: isoprenylcysteine carboxylmethyltransferase family protein [Myxococcota bacterium]|jgi:protein-S-isoprenylcysteine O-methyltransferase Ste14